MQGKIMEQNSKRGRPKGTTSKKSIKKEENYSPEWLATFDKYKRVFEVFEKHKHIYDLYAKCGEIVNFYTNIQDELLNAYKEFHPHYRYNNRCRVCVAEFLHESYKWYFKQIDEVWQS